jgi:hypothetical protein
MNRYDIALKRKPPPKADEQAIMDEMDKAVAQAIDKPLFPQAHDPADWSAYDPILSDHSYTYFVNAPIEHIEVTLNITKNRSTP